MIAEWEKLARQLYAAFYFIFQKNDGKLTLDRMGNYEMETKAKGGMI